MLDAMVTLLYVKTRVYRVSINAEEALRDPLYSLLPNNELLKQ
jgi:hypothetical protein